MPPSAEPQDRPSLWVRVSDYWMENRLRVKSALLVTVGLLIVVGFIFYLHSTVTVR